MGIKGRTTITSTRNIYKKGITVSRNLPVTSLFPKGEGPRVLGPGGPRMSRTKEVRIQDSRTSKTTRSEYVTWGKGLRNEDVYPEKLEDITGHWVSGEGELVQETVGRSPYGVSRNTHQRGSWGSPLTCHSRIRTVHTCGRGLWNHPSKGRSGWSFSRRK